MQIDFAALSNIVISVILSIFGVALVLLVLWHEPSRRSNQYLALAMITLAGYGMANAAWQVPQQYDLDPNTLLSTTTSLYVVGVVMLFNFMIRFAELPHSRRLTAYAAGAVGCVIVLALIWEGEVYTDLEPHDTGSYTYDITLTGQLALGVFITYMLIWLRMLYTHRTARARRLVVTVCVLVVGVVLFGLGPGLRNFSFNVLAVTVAVVLTGRQVLEYQVFQPLADLTAEQFRKNMQLYEATRMKSQFLASMSHELRTPLNSIIGYTDLILDGTYGDLTPLQSDRLHKVTRNGRLLLALINDVLDLSKIEAGRLVLNHERVPTTDVLDSLLREYGPQAAGKGLALVCGYDPLPPVWGDEGRVRQIVSNLVSNAIKFTSAGAVIVRGYHDPDRQQVVLSVTDTGIGIPPEDHPRIFEAFQQSDGSLAREYEGTGLGLAIASRLVAMHGGTIGFDSEPGRGSTFCVTLPAAYGIEPPPTVIVPAPGTEGPVLLVIAPDRTTIGEVRGELGVMPCCVYGAMDANGGLRLAREVGPVLIILDARRVSARRAQVIDALRYDPVTRDVPLLVLGTPGVDVVFDGDDPLMAVLPRPFDSHALQTQVKALCAEAGIAWEVLS